MSGDVITHTFAPGRVARCAVHIMTEFSRKNLAVPATLLAAIVMFCAVFVAFAGPSDAAGEDLSGTYGEKYTIDIAPGYQYTYTATFPEDLEEGVVLSTAVNDLGAQNVNISGHTVTVSIPDDCEAGLYNLVLKAEHAQSSQTAHQYIQFNVSDAFSMNSSGVVTEIIMGASQSIQFTATGGIGDDIRYESVAMPAGLSLDTDTGAVTGTPTTLGLNTVTVKATNYLEDGTAGASKEITVTFTVFSVITGDNLSDETITSINGNQVSSKTITTPSDLGVTWALSEGELPDGFNLDPATGVVSGGSSVYVNETYTIVGTAQNGPSQDTLSKNVTIHAEPTLALTGGDAILTYLNNANPVTSTVTATSGLSTVSWQVSGYEQAAIEGGVVTVTSPATAGMGQTLTVTATTEFGQIQSKEVTLNVEDTLAISGDKTLDGTMGSAATTGAFSVTGGSANTVTVSDNGGFESATYDDDGNTLTVTNSAAKTGTVTLTVTSAAGQTATCQVEVSIFSVLGFDSVPTNGAIAYPMPVDPEE